MVREFVEARGFIRRVESLGGRPLLGHIQTEILANPKAGKVISGLGGVRKLRIGDEAKGRGKRGAFRVLYLDLEDEAFTYFLVLLDKTDDEDISPDEKRIIRRLVQDIKNEVKR